MAQRTFRAVMGLVLAALAGQGRAFAQPDHPAHLRETNAAKGGHPLEPRVAEFLKRQASLRGFRPTGLTRQDYLKAIAGQVRAMRAYQNADGRIIDPVIGEEFAFATPCYAHAVAALAAAGWNVPEAVIESGMRAMDVAVSDMARGVAPNQHGDFFTYPVMLALELYARTAAPARLAAWRESIASLDPRRFYRANKPGGGNWNIVNAAGEHLRAAHGMTAMEYVEACLEAHLGDFNELGMFNENGNPLAYDHFSRYFLSGILYMGYRGAHYAAYRELMARGAWTSLFLQSPTGELATGYRSSHHIWNEAEAAKLYEVYASVYAKAGRMAEAGAFRRAARLSLEAVLRWTRPDGSGYIVKNRYPIEARHGYETYSQHTTYNMLACSMLAAAWQFSAEEIAERPAPADTGGYVVGALRPFHKVFAAAGGSYAEYDTSGDHVYNPTGLIRVHVKGGNPQLGPSDGCSTKFSGPGEEYAVGPAWRMEEGAWRTLAAASPPEPRVEVLEETPGKAAFRATYALPEKVRETVTVEASGVTVESVVEGARALRVYYPMLVFDGEERTAIRLEGNTLMLSLRGGGVRFRVLEPAGARLDRTGLELTHRNGMVEPVFAEVAGNRAVYRIEGLSPAATAHSPQGVDRKRVHTRRK